MRASRVLVAALVLAVALPTAGHEASQERALQPEGHGDGEIVLGDGEIVLGEMSDMDEVLASMGMMAKSVGGNGMGLAQKMQAQMQAQMRQQIEAQARQQEQVIQRAREAPSTFVGGFVLPGLLLFWLVSRLLRTAAPEVHGRWCELSAELVERHLAPPCRGVAAWWRRGGRDLHDVVRILVCVYFVHEGLAVVRRRPLLS